MARGDRNAICAQELLSAQEEASRNAPKRSYQTSHWAGIREHLLFPDLNEGPFQVNTQKELLLKSEAPD